MIGRGIPVKRIIGMLLIFFVVAIACSTDKKKTKMDDVLRSYRKSIRWNAFAHAQGVQKKIAGPIDTELGEIKVTSYDVIKQEISDDFTRVDQTVEIKFYHQRQGKELTLIDEQTWLYDEELEVWQLDGNLPDFSSAIQ